MTGRATSSRGYGSPGLGATGAAVAGPWLPAEPNASTAATSSTGTATSTAPTRIPRTVLDRVSARTARSIRSPPDRAQFQRAALDASAGLEQFGQVRADRFEP